MVEQHRRLSLPPGYKPPRQGPSRARVLARRLVALGVLVVVLGGGALVVRHVTSKPNASRSRSSCSRSSCGSRSRRASPAGTWPKRITAVDGIARRSATSTRAARGRLPRADGEVAAPRLAHLRRRPDRPPARGLPLPEHLQLHREDDDRPARPRPARRRSVRVERARPRATRGPPPERLRRAHHRVDGREGGARARGPAEDRGGDLQPARAGMALGIDATLRYGLEHPGDEAARALREQHEPLQHAQVPRPAADADREPRRPSLQARRRTRRASADLYFLAKPDKRHTYFTRASRTSSTTSSSTGTSRDRRDDDASSGCSAIRSRSRSPRRCRTPRSRRRVSTGPTSRSASAGRPRGGGARARGARLRGRERHDPAQARRRRLLRHARSRGGAGGLGRTRS